MTALNRSKELLGLGARVVADIGVSVGMNATRERRGDPIEIPTDPEEDATTQIPNAFHQKRTDGRLLKPAHAYWQHAHDGSRKFEKPVRRSRNLGDVRVVGRSTWSTMIRDLI